MIFVSLHKKTAKLTFRFLEIKHRQHLRSSRDIALVEAIHEQLKNFRQRWDSQYSDTKINGVFRSLRLAKLARILRFYLDKARRHSDDKRQMGLSQETHKRLLNEIHSMLSKKEYEFPSSDQPDQGWIFCPEYAGVELDQITQDDAALPVFRFGPSFNPRRGETMPVEMIQPVATFENIPQQTLRGNNSEKTVSPQISSPFPVNKPKNDAVSAEPTVAKDTIPHEVSNAVPSIILGTSTVVQENICWTPNIKGNPHLLVAGLPGMGKTTCLLNICEQMYQSKIVPIVFSYHQDFDDELEKRIGSVRFVRSHDLGFNPLRVSDRSSPTAYLDTVGALRDIFLAIYPDFGDIQLGKIRSALRDSFHEQGWNDKSADFQTLEEPSFSRFYDILFLSETAKKDRALEPIAIRLEELKEYGFFNSESNCDLWSSTTPVVIRLHENRQHNVQKAFSALIFYGLYQDMFRRGLQQRISHALIFDEAHRASRLSLIPTMAKECRKFGISLLVASQEAKDFHPSLFSAIANYLILRLNDVDAKFLAKNIVSSDHERNVYNSTVCIPSVFL